MNAIVDKIRKLRALASSANLNEAAAAAAAAERLIQEHNLAEAEIAASGEAPADERVEAEEIGTFKGKLATWQSNLVVHLMMAYQCSGYWQRTRRNGVIVGYRFVAYGRPSDLATFRYQAAFYALEIERLAQESGQGRGRRFLNSFRLGAVRAIGEALAAVRAEVKLAATTTALAVVDQRAEEAKRRRDEENGDLLNGRKRPSQVDREAYQAGREAGSLINQRAALGEGTSRRLTAGGS